MGTLAAQIEDRIALLSDPNTNWVRGNPTNEKSCCLAWDGFDDPDACAAIRVHDTLYDFLDEIVGDYARLSDDRYEGYFPAHFYDSDAPQDPEDFNDTYANGRQDVINFLNVALDIAEDEGL